MRVLGVCRHFFGEHLWLARSVIAPLAARGVEFVLDDASGWIPDQTGRKVDKSVSARIREAARGFDLVHAWGYRTAWACSAAFGITFPWIYTAHELSKTTHPALIEKLACARLGLCSARAIRQQLALAETPHATLMVPGVEIPRETRARGEEVVFWGEHPRGLSPEILEADLDEWLDRAKLCVVVGARHGASLVAMKAMARGVPVLLQKAGGLEDMGLAGREALFFEDPERLDEILPSILEDEARLASLGEQGRLRAEQEYDLEDFADRLADAYEEVLSA